MGGFFLARTPVDDALAPREMVIADRVFARKRLPRDAVLRRPEFILHLYGKRQTTLPHLVERPGGEFAACTGAFFYRGLHGAAALEAILDEAPMAHPPGPQGAGHFALLMYREGRLTLTRDRLGLYRVYTDREQTILSSSFLAMENTLPRLTPASQEIYEYVFHGAFYGGRTVFEEVELLQTDLVWDGPGPPSAMSVPGLDQEPRYATVDDAVEDVADTLCTYFDMLASNYQGNVTSALTGGYDTRLMLALGRRVGLDPALYVYGTGKSREVSVAKDIAVGEGLELKHVDWDTHPNVPVDAYGSLIDNQYWCLDGFHNTGVFDGGGNYAERLRRTERAVLQLNGSGGEIYRDFWLLPDRPVAVERFVRSFYASFDPAVARPPFRVAGYFTQLGAKVRAVAGVPNGPLPRTTVEAMYPEFRLRFWMGVNNALNNELALGVTPFAEHAITRQSARIPITWKRCGRFEARLIAFLDPALAAYPSLYGHNFLNDPPVTVRLGSWLSRTAPITLRAPILRRMMNPSHPLPYYLTPPYINSIFGNRDWAVDEWFRRGAIRSPAMLSRVLTLELHLRGMMQP